MAQYYVAMFDGPPEAVITVLIEILGLHNMDDIQHVWSNSANDDLFGPINIYVHFGLCNLCSGALQIMWIIGII